ncbi:sulfite exporter TauE/SafE family protein, partial [Rhizobium ruizarguesonis]
MTPLLIFYNIPPVVAVATGANQVVASSISGAITHFRRGSLDVKLGTVLLVGGLTGATVGIWIFSLLRAIGQLVARCSPHGIDAFEQHQSADGAEED